MGKLGILKEVFELFILHRKFYMLTKMGSQGGLFILVGRKKCFLMSVQVSYKNQFIVYILLVH